MKIIIRILPLILLLTSCDFKINDEKFIIYPELNDNLKPLDSLQISQLIYEPSVGNNEIIGTNTFFIPINFDARASKVGKYNVPVGDLFITEKVNEFEPIRFEMEKDDAFLLDGKRNTFLFFIPSKDKNAITQKKLLNQFDSITFYDHNSLISKNTVIHYEYNENKKGFDLFHSVKIDMNSDNTQNERLYESVDILRLAKNLNNTTAKPMDWEKIDFVTPMLFNRYLSKPILDTLLLMVKSQPNNFKYEFEFDKLQLKLYSVKDSSLTKLFNDLNVNSVLNKELEIEDFLAHESSRILSDYLKIYDDKLKVTKEDKNIFFVDDFFSNFILCFSKNKEILFVIKDETLFNEYNDQIYYRYFNKIIVQKLNEIESK